MAARVGRSTVVFASGDTPDLSTFAFLLTGASGWGYSRTSIDTTDVLDVGLQHSGVSQMADLRTIVVRTMAPGSITPKPITLNCSFDPDEVFPIVPTATSLTISFPSAAGVAGGGASFAASCFVTSIQVDDFGNFDGPITCTIEVMPVGEWTYANE